MSSLTRWVLAHKRIVVLAWIVLTIAGMAAAGPASDALDQKFSVPGKEGWETNVDDRRSATAAPAATPRRCVPVVTLPDGQDASTRRPSRADLAKVDERLERGAARLADRLLRLDRRRDLRLRGRPDRRSRSSTRRPIRTPPFGDNPEAEKTARAALDGRDRRRRSRCT